MTFEECSTCGQTFSSHEMYPVPGGFLCHICQQHDAPDEYGDGTEPADPYDDVEELQCSLCGEVMVWESCWYCMGAGGFHDCGEDCCPCADPDDDLNEDCPECDGQGEYPVCPCAGKPGHGEERNENAGA